MSDERRFQLLTVAEKLRTLRRYYNNVLNDLVDGRIDPLYNGEDLVRLVGTLEAAYNHVLVSLVSDGDVYCLLKHISYAIILAGEMDVPEVENLYELITIVSDGKIEPCSSCKREENNDKKGAQDE